MFETLKAWSFQVEALPLRRYTIQRGDAHYIVNDYLVRYLVFGIPILIQNIEGVGERHLHALYGKRLYMIDFWL